MAFFSVIIPLYNKENYIENTIESVLSQSYTDFEIIVINDCSTDKSIEKVRLLYDSRITIIEHEQNKGLSASRNTGIRHSNSDYIAFLDADDLWKPSFLEKIHTLIQKFPNAGLYATDFEIVYSENTILPTIKSLHDFPVESMNIVEDFFISNLYYPIFCPSSLCVKKEVFETIGFYDENITYGEDLDFNIRANYRYQLAYYNFSCVKYLMFSQNQITTSNFAAKTIPDFNKYESWSIEKPSLKKYLDFQRYSLGLNYKVAGATAKFSELIRNIDSKNLTLRQRIILKTPVILIKLAKKVKHHFMRKGIQLTSFS